jgi:hypothetical protein
MAVTPSPPRKRVMMGAHPDTKAKLLHSHSHASEGDPTKHRHRDGAESGVGARALHREVAHLLEVIEGVGAVLRTSCHDAWSTHLRAGAAHAVGSGGLEFKVPQDSTGCT